MRQGWIKIYRDIIDNPIWRDSTPEQCKILITLLSMASWKESSWDWLGEKKKLQPGQFVTSLKSIVNFAGKGISEQKIRTALIRFESYGFLTCKSTNKGRLITIVNWGKYQELDDFCNNQNNRQVTSNQQATNKQLTVNQQANNKEGKKVRKEEGKKVITTSTYMCFKPPELEEVKEYIKEKGYSFSPEAFVAYYDSKGWMIGKSKMKSWKSACVTWQLRQQNNRPSRGISSKDEWEGVTGL